jgi:predicted nucleotidyltransferase
MIKKFNEYFVQAQFEPIKSFHLKDEMNPEIWTDYKINDEVREELIQIAQDYFESLDLDDVELSDIMLTGSLANFNWSKYSDFDLHLIFEFAEVNEDEVLVKKYLDAAGKVWNEQHDIKIKGYEVEIYSQNTKEKHTSSGQFSLLNNEWIEKPTKENFVPDEDLIRQKAELIMSSVNDLESDLDENVEYEELMTKLKKVWKKIKEGRQAGLDREGEYSVENLVFKLLRRNGYIQRILDVRRKSYDKQFK